MGQSTWIIRRPNGTVERRCMDIPDLPHAGDYVAMREGSEAVTYRVDSVRHQWNYLPPDVTWHISTCDIVLGVEKWPTIHAVEVADLPEEE